MPLTNSKLELKLKSAKNWVLSTAGPDNVKGNFNDNANVNYIISTITDTKLYVPFVTSSGRDNQKILKLLSKGCKRSVF